MGAGSRCRRRFYVCAKCTYSAKWMGEGVVGEVKVLVGAGHVGVGAWHVGVGAGHVGVNECWQCRDGMM